MSHQPVLYDEDFEGWLLSQAAFLRSRSANALDWDNLAEEVESLGRSQYSELVSRLSRIVGHLIKLKHGRYRALERSWAESVNAQRTDLELLLLQNPGLKSRFDDAHAFACRKGKSEALISFFKYEPELQELYDAEIAAAPDFTVEECLDNSFFPDGPKA